jgi:hypothetical protein
MKPRKPFLLRIEPDLYQQLEAWAQQELRSVNGQIEYLLRQALRKRKGEGSAKPPGDPASAENRSSEGPSR